jgi:hypothetical protein
MPPRRSALRFRFAVLASTADCANHQKRLYLDVYVVERAGLEPATNGFGFGRSQPLV